MESPYILLNVHIILILYIYLHQTTCVKVTVTPALE